MLARLQHFLQRNRHIAVTAIGAVVGHHDQFVGAGLKLLLQDQQILAAEADDAGHLGAQAMELLRHRHSDGAARAAAYHAHLFDPFGMSGNTQRAGEVLQGIARLLVVQDLRGRADHLEDNLHRAFFGIGSRHSQRDALPFFIHAQNDELAGLGFPGHQRRVHLDLRHSGVQHPLPDDFIHRYSLHSDKRRPLVIKSRL